MDEELIKAAAIRLCKIRGQSPDELVQHGEQPDQFGFVKMVLRSSLRWQLVAGEIRAHMQRCQAVDEARTALGVG